MHSNGRVSSLTRLSHTRLIASYDLEEPEALILHFIRGRPQKRLQRGIDFGFLATHACVREHMSMLALVYGRHGLRAGY